jgi:F-type H+-transporting ATPase subunit b
MFEFDAEIFVALAFIIFVGLLIYVGVHTKIAAVLDGRVESVKGELAEAERLRAEAASLLASFETRRKEAEADAAAIIAQAKQEAAMLAQEAQARVSDFIARRTKQAEEKIALAETQAASEVRAAAADAAVKAAATVMGSTLKGDAGAGLVDSGIADLKRLMH